MPYKVQQDGSRFCVYVKASGKKLGCHKTRKEAQAQIAAIEANEAKKKGE